MTQEDDVILQVTGTTVCGSDLHLYHSEIVALKQGDILGHEFMGKVERMGKNVKNLKVGQRVVSSFQVAWCVLPQTSPHSLRPATYSSSLPASLPFPRRHCPLSSGECRYCKQKLSSFCDRTNDSSLMQTMYGARDAGFFGYVGTGYEACSAKEVRARVDQSFPTGMLTSRADTRAARPSTSVCPRAM